MRTHRRLLPLFVAGAAFAASAISACSSQHDERASRTLHTEIVVTNAAATELLVLRGGALVGVAAQNGASAALGSDDWSGAHAIASIGGAAYAVAGPTLFRIDPATGARTPVGTGDWTGTSLLASYDGYLYAIQGAGLFRVNPTDGSYQRIGTGDWTGTGAFVGDTADDLDVYAVQGPALYAVDAFGGSWRRLGSGDWTGTTAMAGLGGSLYAIQGPGLWRVNLTDGTWARVGTQDWTGATALVSDTRRLFALQGGHLFDIDPQTGSAAQLDGDDWTAAVAMTSTVAAKAVKSWNMSAANLDATLHSVLGSTYVRFDETGDPAQLLDFTGRHQVCGPASAAAIAACRATCIANDDGDPSTLKGCLTSCSQLQTCSGVCDDHQTANFAILSDTLKNAAQKMCNSPDDTCPPCTVGQPTSAIEDYDFAQWMPVPVYHDVILGNPFSCTLRTLGFSMDSSASSLTVASDAGGLHLDIPGFSSDPTLVCTNGFNPTFVNPTLHFDLDAQVVNHHPTLAITSNFHTEVNYAFDWIASLDGKVSSAVTGALAGVISNAQGSLDAGFEGWLRKEIQLNGDQVDDWVSATFDANGLTVRYTPSCANGVCSCTPDCGAKKCGNDLHCGTALCGTCGAGLQCDEGAGACVCAPQCNGKTCGPDGCGGVCGTCKSGTTCLQNAGTCCTPQCSGKTCGHDGCGGTCGNCDTSTAPNNTCNSAGQCTCTPATVASCTTCGVSIPDGCGGFVQCRACKCTPSCAGKKCGAGDGCGGQCSGKCTKPGWVCTDDGNGPYCAPPNAGM
jgi:hypothetical protein